MTYHRPSPVNKVMVLAFIAVSSATAGFALGRGFASTETIQLPKPGPTITVSASPSPTTGRHVPWLYRAADPSKRWILQWFAEAEEEQLPAQGILGGEVRPWTVIFPKGFAGRKNDRYYVSGSDGHFGQWWIFRGNRTGKPLLICPTVGPKPNGCPGPRFGDNVRRLRERGFEVWKLLPSYYISP